MKNKYNLGTAPIVAVFWMGYSQTAYKIIHLACLFYLIILFWYLLVRLQLTDNTLLLFIGFAVCLSNAAFLVSVLRYKWHMLSLFGFVCFADILTKNRLHAMGSSKKKLSHLAHVLLSAFTIFFYYFNALFFSAFVFVNLKEAYKSLRLNHLNKLFYFTAATAIFILCLLFVDTSEIYRRLTDSLTFSWNQKSWLDGFVISLGQTKHALSKYFSAPFLILVLIGLYSLIKGALDKKIKLYVLISFFVPLIIQLFSEGLWNPDWHWWIWPSVFVIQIYGIVYLYEKIIKIRAINKHLTLAAVYLSLVLVIAFQVANFPHTYLTQRHRPDHGLRRDAALLIFDHMKNNPDAYFIMPSASLPLHNGGFDYGSILAFKEVNELIRSGRLKFINSKDKLSEEIKYKLVRSKALRDADRAYKKLVIGNDKLSSFVWIK